MNEAKRFSFWKEVTSPYFTVPPAFRSLRCYFSVNNVFTLTGYTGGDPANINVNGVEPGIETTSIYPVARTFTLGLSVQF